MRVVLLTAGGVYAERILRGLALAEIVPEAVVISWASPAATSLRSGARELLRSRSPRRALAAVARRALWRLDPSARPSAGAPVEEQWRGLARAIVRVGGLRDAGCAAAIASLRPDLVALGGVGIVGEDVLRLPRLGTINVHPGLLPWVRGNGVVERSIQRGVAVGVSAHFVNAGIDTGAIITRELIPVTPYDTVRSLQLKADERCARLMVELIAAACEGRPLEAVPQSKRYPYCKWPDARERPQIASMVAAGAAVHLYEQWRTLVGSRVLPQAFHVEPELVPPIAAISD